jgi:hypothetical protein
MHGAGFNAGSVTHWTCALPFTGFVTWHVVLNGKAYRRHIAEVSGGLLFSPKRAVRPPSDRRRARGAIVHALIGG